MIKEDRIKSIKMSGDKCKLSGSKSILDCHCNECSDNVIEYLGKKKGKIYKYTGKFTKEYLRDRLVVIIKFCVDYDDKPSTCEAFIKLKGGSGGQCEWIPRNEIINYLT